MFRCTQIVRVVADVPFRSSLELYGAFNSGWYFNTEQYSGFSGACYFGCCFGCTRWVRPNGTADLLLDVVWVVVSVVPCECIRTVRWI